MVVKVTKIEPASFVGSDGNQVNGYHVYVTYPLSDRVFVSGKTDISTLKEGHKYNFDYNNKGKLLGFSEV